MFASIHNNNVDFRPVLFVAAIMLAGIALYAGLLTGCRVDETSGNLGWNLAFFLTVAGIFALPGAWRSRRSLKFLRTEEEVQRLVDRLRTRVAQGLAHPVSLTEAEALIQQEAIQPKYVRFDEAFAEMVLADVNDFLSRRMLDTDELWLYVLGKQTWFGWRGTWGFAIVRAGAVVDSTSVISTSY